MKIIKVLFKFKDSIELAKSDFEGIDIDLKYYLGNIKVMKECGFKFLSGKENVSKVTLILKDVKKPLHFLFYGDSEISQNIKNQLPLPKINLLNWIYADFEDINEAKKIIQELKKYPNTIQNAYIRSNPIPANFNQNVPTSPTLIEGGHLKAIGYFEALETFRDYLQSLNIQDSATRNFGKNIKIVIIDKGFTIRFPDMDNQLYYEYTINQNLPNFNLSFEDKQHGTNTIGVIKSNNDGNGSTGIAPLSNVVLAVTNDENDGFDYGNVLFYSILNIICDANKVGAIILLEISLSNSLPLESAGIIKDLFTIAYHYGITIIEPAGNGQINLNFPFNINNEINLGSSAIMVGALFFRSGVPTNIKGLSNYGQRIDTYMIGEYILTTGMGIDNNDYSTVYKYSFFENTSGASAIIAGMVAAIQDVAIVKFGHALSPDEIKELLSNNQPLVSNDSFYQRLLNFRQFFNGGKNRIYSIPNLNTIITTIINS